MSFSRAALDRPSLLFLLPPTLTVCEGQKTSGSPSATKQANRPVAPSLAFPSPPRSRSGSSPTLGSPSHCCSAECPDPARRLSHPHAWEWGGSGAEPGRPAPLPRCLCLAGALAAPEAVSRRVYESQSRAGAAARPTRRLPLQGRGWPARPGPGEAAGSAEVEAAAAPPCEATQDALLSSPESGEDERAAGIKGRPSRLFPRIELAAEPWAPRLACSTGGSGIALLGIPGPLRPQQETQLGAAAATALAPKVSQTDGAWDGKR